MLPDDKLGFPKLRPVAATPTVKYAWLNVPRSHSIQIATTTTHPPHTACQVLLPLTHLPVLPVLLHVHQPVLCLQLVSHGLLAFCCRLLQAVLQLRDCVLRLRQRRAQLLVAAAQGLALLRCAGKLLLAHHQPLPQRQECQVIRL